MIPWLLRTPFRTWDRGRTRDLVRTRNQGPRTKDQLSIAPILPQVAAILAQITPVSAPLALVAFQLAPVLSRLAPISCAQIGSHFPLVAANLARIVPDLAAILADLPAILFDVVCRESRSREPQQEQARNGRKLLHLFLHIHVRWLACHCTQRPVLRSYP
jgi:hypothetical protein